MTRPMPRCAQPGRSGIADGVNIEQEKRQEPVRIIVKVEHDVIVLFEQLLGGTSECRAVA